MSGGSETDFLQEDRLRGDDIDESETSDGSRHGVARGLSGLLPLHCLVGFKVSLPTQLLSYEEGEPLEVLHILLPVRKEEVAIRDHPNICRERHGFEEEAKAPSLEGLCANRRLMDASLIDGERRSYVNHSAKNFYRKLSSEPRKEDVFTEHRHEYRWREKCTVKTSSWAWERDDEIYASFSFHLAKKLASCPECTIYLGSSELLELAKKM